MNTDEIKAAYIARLDKEAAVCREKADALLASGCADDALFEKIRLNIVGVFKSVAGVCGGDNPEVYRDAVLKRFDTIPASWIKRKGEAEAHSDFGTKSIEEVKLEEAAKLKALFLELYEVQS